MLSEHLKRLLPRRPKRFLAWQIDITTRCRLACRMCIRRGLPGWTEADMGLADFVRLVPYFDDVETVILQGWGEPLLHGELMSIVGAAKGTYLPVGAPPLPSGFRPPAVGFVTSGKGLDKQTCAGLLDAGLDFIGFSFAGSRSATHEAIRVNSDFQELVGAVRSFAELKKVRGVERPRIHIVFLMVKDNLQDLPSLPRLARDLGVGEIVLTNLVHVTTDWQDEQKVFTCNGSGDAADAVSAAEEAGRDLGVQVRRPSLFPRTVAVCEEDPLHTLYVSPHGDVSPCVYLHPPTGREFTRIFCGRPHQVERVSFGNILKEPFDHLWGKEEYASFRKQIAGRRERSQAMTAPFVPFGMKVGRDAPTRLPEPPEPCRTCHKMLGL